MNRIGKAYISWAQRRSETVQVALALTTIFLLFGVVFPVLDTVEWVRSVFQRNREGET